MGKVVHRGKPGFGASASVITGWREHICQGGVFTP